MEKAQQDISTLRHLAQLKDSGILTGNLSRIVSNNPWKSASVPSRKVIAKRVSDGAEYTALTDDKGHYEFELPPNSYNLTTNAERGLWAPDTTTFILQRGCVDVDFLLHTDSRISGRVTTADGKPARYGKWPLSQSPQKDSLSLSLLTNKDILKWEEGNLVAILSAQAFCRKQEGQSGNHVCTIPAYPTKNRQK